MEAKRFASFLGCTLLGALAVASLARPAAAQDPAYSLDQLERLVESGIFSSERILERAAESCLGFRLEGGAEARLRRAGASDELIDGLRKVCVRLPVRVVEVRIGPQDLELPVGAVRALAVEALRSDSTVLEDATVVWSSADTAIADVFSNGIVIAKSLGATTISARAADDVVGTMALRVVDARDAPSGATYGKSPAAAAVLGTVVPGGGEFYTGNSAKGAIVLLGTAGALAAGILLSSEDTVPADPLISETCEDGSCSLEVTPVSQVETNPAVLAVAVAGAFWAFGLIDGVLTARRSGPPATAEMIPARSGLSIELLPSDGVRVNRAGEVDLTLLRVR